VNFLAFIVSLGNLMNFNENLLAECQ